MRDEQVAAVVGFLSNMEKVLRQFAVAFDELRNYEQAPSKEHVTVLRDHRESTSPCADRSELPSRHRRLTT